MAMRVATYTNRGAAVSAFLLTLVLVGCSSDRKLDKVIVTGSVTYNSSPIPNGQIRFTPMEGTKGPVSGSRIVDGKYKADGKGGVPVGKHRVSFKAFRPRGGTETNDPDERGVFEQYLPEKYFVNSTIEVTIDDESGTVVKNFELTD